MQGYSFFHHRCLNTNAVLRLTGPRKGAVEPRMRRPVSKKKKKKNPSMAGPALSGTVNGLLVSLERNNSAIGGVARLALHKDTDDVLEKATQEVW